MPLHDHFHPPVSKKIAWDTTHSTWIASIHRQLDRILPPNFIALPQIHIGGSLEIVVGTFENENPETQPQNSNGYN